MKIVVLGARGRLGNRLTQLLSADHEVIGLTSADLDITDFYAVKASITDIQPQIVLNPAAWTDVDGCAREPEKAIRINGFGAQHVAVAAAEVGAAVLYVSSNEVFDGRGSRPYYEYDATNPANPYGYSKWVGERAVMTLNPRHYVVRASWFFAHGGKNFIQTILGAAQAGKTLRVVTDEVANPTYTDDLAEAIAELITSERFGVYHLVNQGACSRYAFARYVLDCAGYNDTPITPISHHEWQRPSTPPVYSSLANLAGKQIGIELRSWQAAVDAFLAREGFA